MHLAQEKGFPRLSQGRDEIIHGDSFFWCLIDTGCSLKGRFHYVFHFSRMHLSANPGSTKIIRQVDASVDVDLVSVII